MVKALAGLPEYQGSIPSTHISGLQLLKFQLKISNSLFWPPQVPAHTLLIHTDTEIKKQNVCKSEECFNFLFLFLQCFWNFKHDTRKIKQQVTVWVTIWQGRKGSWRIVSTYEVPGDTHVPNNFPPGQSNLIVNLRKPRHMVFSCLVRSHLGFIEAAPTSRKTCQTG